LFGQGSAGKVFAGELPTAEVDGDLYVHISAVLFADEIRLGDVPMAESRIPGPASAPACFASDRSPGPLGWNDQSDMKISSLLGNTPGSLGYKDLGDPTLPVIGSCSSKPNAPAENMCRVGGAPVIRGTGKLENLNTSVLVFPDTDFKYQRTTKTLESCLATLPSELRPDFKTEIEKIITGMYDLGFALGISAGANAGYRTFEGQCNIAAGATRAGPGESFHNYLAAVDLGFLQWVDEKGKAHSDYWLGAMGSIKALAGFPAKLWATRNSFSDKVYALDFEVIHLQSVPAATSGPAMLVKCLNSAAAAAGDIGWMYQRKGKEYQCTLGSREPKAWTSIGSAKQMWNKSSGKCTEEQDETIRKHMESAESLAKTIELE
jgi:hypothetical protein